VIEESLILLSPDEPQGTSWCGVSNASLEYSFPIPTKVGIQKYSRTGWIPIPYQVWDKLSSGWNITEG
jgi:hypothetical protein